MSTQVDGAVRNVYGMLVLIRQNIKHRSWHIMLNLDESLPCYRRDVIRVEIMQKRSTGMLPGFENLSDKE